MRLFALLLAATAVWSGAPGDRMKDRILVYTHNGKGPDGKGYVHLNIPGRSLFSPLLADTVKAALK